MNGGVTNPTQAMDQVVRWFKEGADKGGLPLHSDCEDKFRKENQKKFDELFEKYWDHSKQKLQQVASLHGELAARVLKLGDPAAKEVPLRVFGDVGKVIKQHACGTRGDWCQWP